MQSLARSPYPVAVYLACVALLLFWGFSAWAYDDPFITYRYARNLAHGLGFVYNPGSRVLSTTTPLFALILAVPAALGVDLLRAANLVGVASLAVGAFSLWSLAAEWKEPWVGWAALALYPFSPLLLRTLSSETPLYITLCLGAFVFYARSRYTWTAVLCALAVLTRPDGVLVPGLLALHFLLARRGRVPWQALAVFGGLVLPWFAFAWLYFGSPLPLTLLAKQQQGTLAVSRGFAPAFLDLAASHGQLWNYRLQAVLAVMGLGYLILHARLWGLLLSWTFLYFAAYTLLGVSSYYWYYAPLVPGFVVLVGLGLAGLNFWVKKVLRAGSGGWATVGAGLGAGLAAFLLLGMGAAQVGDAVRLQHMNDPRVGLYRQVGAWLEANTPPGASVGMLEAGVVGYFADRTVVDFAGLFQPELSARLGQLGDYGAAARWAVARYRPDYLVLQAGMFGGLEQAYPGGECRRLASFSGGPYGYLYDLEVFRCR